MKNTRRIKQIIAAILLCLILSIPMFGCSSCDRYMKSCASEYGDGLRRIINIYDYEGDKIATYEGKIDVEENDTKVLFDLDGKRYIYYNCLVEVIEIE